MNKKIHIRAYSAIKLSKKQERLIVIGLAAFLVGYFCFQVAYGMTGNGTITYSGGMDITNPTQWVKLANDTWTMYNSTSGSTSTITFRSVAHHHATTIDNHLIKWDLDTATWVRVLNGHIYKGLTMLNSDGTTSNMDNLMLCKRAPHYLNIAMTECHTLILTKLSTNYLEFKDEHGGTIHLMRQGSDMSGMNMSRIYNENPR